MKNLFLVFALLLGISLTANANTVTAHVTSTLASHASQWSRNCRTCSQGYPNSRLIQCKLVITDVNYVTLAESYYTLSNGALTLSLDVPLPIGQNADDMEVIAGLDCGQEFVNDLSAYDLETYPYHFWLNDGVTQNVLMLLYPESGV